MTKLQKIGKFKAPRGMVVALSAVACALGMGAATPARAQSAAPLAQPNNAALIAAAKAEGGLTLYGTSSVAALKADAEGFEKAYGIPVTYLQLTSAPLTARIDQEAKAGRIQADVIISADPANLNRWVAEGLLAKLPDVNFPQKTDYLVPIQIIFQGIHYNTSTIPAGSVPKDWNDVLDQKYSGKIVLGSPRIGPTYSTLYYALWKDPRYGEPFFEKLAALKARVVQTNPLVAQSVASGEAAIGFTGIPYDAVNVRAANPGAPIDYAYLNMVTMGSTYAAISAKSQKPNGARLLIEWLMSPAGQAVHNGDNRASSLIGSFPGTLPSAPMDRVNTKLDAEIVSKEYQALIALFDRLFK